MTKRITKTLGIVAAICGLLTAFTGCDKEGLSHGGKAIKFTATTKPSPDTRTAYSNVIDSSKERIDWSTNDQFTLWSDVARVTGSNDVNFSDYKVTEVTADGYISNAKIANVGANGLSFNNGESFSGKIASQFWAVYPPTVTLNKVNDNTVRFENDGDSKIGFTAKMEGMTGSGSNYQYLKQKTYSNNVVKYEPENLATFAYMTAHTSGNYSEDDKIELSFYPAFTAYEVEIKCAADNDDEIGISTFWITGARENFVAVYDNGAWSYTAADTPKTVEARFRGNTPPTITKTKSIIFTVLGLPVKNESPTITFECVNGSETFRKKLVLTGVTFAACKKHKLTGLLLPGNEWKITFAEEGMEVKEWISSDDNDQTLVVE